MSASACFSISLNPGMHARMDSVQILDPMANKKGEKLQTVNYEILFGQQFLKY